MSDSHDNLSAIDKAVKRFNESQVLAVLHAGDVISPFTAKNFQKLDAHLYLVFGNNDGEKKGLMNKFQGFATHLGIFGEVEIHNTKFAMYHGAHEKITTALLNSNQYDYLITGHTHGKEIEKVNETTMINPGETCGYLTGKQRIAILDLDSKEIESIEL